MTETNGLITFAGNETGPQVGLAPLQAPDKVQPDMSTRANWPMLPDEEVAYKRLPVRLSEAADGAKVRGGWLLKKTGDEFFLEVRTAAINSVAV